jgi:MFS family permease
LAVIINGAASIYNPAFNAIIADSMPEEKRGAGYGAYRTITSMPRIFSPLIGGIVMDMMGYKEGVRVFLVLSMITAIIITSVRAWAIKETLDLGDPSEVKERKTPFKDSVKETLTLPRQIWYMVIVAILGSFGSRLVMSYIPIYAMGAEGLALSSSQYGLIQTIGAIFNTVLAMPGGLMADRFGRKPMILLSRITGPLSLGLIPFTHSYESFFGARILNNIGAALGGGGRGRAGGPSWNAMLADMVPPEKRGTVLGTIGTLTGIIGVPSPIIGSYLWEVFSPMAAFQTSSIIGFLGAIIFFLFVKEHHGKHISFGLLPVNSGD